MNFTIELNVNNKLPFLDVLVDTSNGKFHTSVYHKPTNTGHCLNYKSECTDKYKNSVITNYLNRAYKISSTWKDFHHEVLHIKQVLINNNYPNKIVDDHIQIFIQNKLKTNNKPRDNNSIKIYYQNQTHGQYKIDERIIKDIVSRNTSCTKSDQQLRIIFYYKNKKTHNLVMKNNLTPTLPTLQQRGLVYKFQCPLPHSKAVTYIGFTQTTLSRRLTMHGQNGSIYNHFINSHNCKPTRDQLTENTIIITRDTDRYKLAIKEALIIINDSPSLNIQFDNFSNILKLHHRNSSQITDSCQISKYKTKSEYSEGNVISQINQNPPSYNNTQILANPPPLLHSSNVRISEADENINSHIDMERVLLRFGINCNNLTIVPLEKYYWWYFGDLEPSLQDRSPSFLDPCELQQQDKSNNFVDESTLTISQRIRTLRRSTISKYKSHKPCS